METKSAAMKEVINFHKKNWKNGDTIPSGFMLDALGTGIVPVSKNPLKQKYFNAGGDAKLKSLILGVLREIRPVTDIPVRAQNLLLEDKIQFVKDTKYNAIVDRIRSSNAAE